MERPLLGLRLSKGQLCCSISLTEPEELDQNQPRRSGSEPAEQLTGEMFSASELKAAASHRNRLMTFHLSQVTPPRLSAPPSRAALCTETSKHPEINPNLSGRVQTRSATSSGSDSSCRGEEAVSVTRGEEGRCS